MLGWAWTRLRRTNGGWRGSLRLGGSGAARSRDAQARLEQAAVHLARTLSEPPGRFHERWRMMRWARYGSRLVPILASVAVVSGLVLLQAVSWLGHALASVLMLIVPPLLMLACLVIRDIPGVDRPPLPRRSAISTWRGK